MSGPVPAFETARKLLEYARDHDDYTVELDHFEANALLSALDENERLRGALEQIAAPKVWVQEYRQAVDIARNALEGGKG